MYKLVFIPLLLVVVAVSTRAQEITVVERATLQPVTDGLALLPYGNGVHYDSERQRRPLLHDLVGEGVLPTSYATDDGVGVLYEGTEAVAVPVQPKALDADRTTV